MIKDITGQTFNKLTVIEYSNTRLVQNKKTGYITKFHYFRCKCECGNTSIVEQRNIVSGHTKSCGCLKKFNLTGQKFGEWTILSKHVLINNGKTSGAWLCRCSCGKEIVVRQNSLLKGKSSKCKQCALSVKKGGHKDISACYWQRIRKNAATRKYDFNISIEYAWEVLLQQDKKCALSGIDLCCTHQRKKMTASIDRINPKIGYIIGNIQWVHKDINRLKWKLTDNEFISMCHQIALYQNKGEII